MGISMGINDKVIMNLNYIGFYSLIFTTITMLFSVIVVSIFRRLMGLNRYGLFETDKTIEEKIKEVEKENNKKNTTHLIVMSVTIGMLTGFVGKDFIADYEFLIGYMITIGLSLLLLFVGMDLGLNDELVKCIKELGIKVFLFPVAIVIGTLIGSVISGIFIPINFKESLAIGAGFAWYSFAPGLIIEKGFIIVGAISFMHNIMREVFAIIAIPIVAEKIGYIEVLGLGASANMDIALPIVEKSTHSIIVIYSFVSGITVSLLVPILVPIFIA
ncbi:MAG TPA: lysine exporter LysO family protein [Anaerovoracaceae bacterium]|nr:lysine exporter LysO family protein [Anaerovoracaceae bacterium]